ncbi:ComEC/Rec2 family competence protein [Oceanicella actignis]|uniref:Competence protein ComEC n=1 Tax=Oceanicella actignis TaxID=1189325 RepID=A0A1M7RT00_9RHOB|nr:ComEC/Rec2 family competence protein [Oceanicella actignis]SET05474.1 competence protein ComEC [Oceanicella actignis]SHN49256.1 competence protein ComEC [Oceanicella actignis]
MRREDLVDWLLRERRRAALWAPVCFGFGSWVYFQGPDEPGAWALSAATAAAAALIPAAFAGRAPWLRLALMALGLLCAGFSAAGLRARAVAAPVLPAATDATVEGRIVEITRSRTDMRRVMLEDVIIYGLARADTPRRVRVSLLEGDFARDVRVGERVALYARIGPPAPPVEPGGFDFRRWAWFHGVGGVGFARGPAMPAPPAELQGPLARAQDWIGRARGAIARAIQAAVPGERGAFAAAILVGVREGVTQEALQALRDSNLAHLLAISGLHMGLLSALVFAVARMALALIPAAALRVEPKKAAAAAAMAAGLVYLVLSGASVATQRAFLMAAVALTALMIDRAAISLRALAAAALVILLLRPESLFDAGFQMSFAATGALIAFYEWVRERGLTQSPEQRPGLPWRIGRIAAGVALTSLIAGMATAPFAAAAFNRLPLYGLPANMIAVPVMSFWVMPAAVLAAALAPLGAAGPALWAMGEGIGVILHVARLAAQMPDAVRPVVAPPEGALALIALGGLWLCLWRTRMRLGGAAALAAGLAMWAQGGDRPELLIAPEGQAIGLMGPEGRAVDRARGAGYAIETWLARDGDGADQKTAAARPGLERDKTGARGEMSNGWRVALAGRRAPDPAALCAPRTLLILPRRPGPAPEGGCLALTDAELARLGAAAVRPDGDALRIEGALPAARGRLWGGGGG